jgi:hypothetical protein
MPKLKKPKRSSRRTGLVSMSAPVTIRAAATEGQPRTFELVAYTGEPMRIWGFDDPVVIDCSTLDITAQTIPALYDHYADERNIVGQVKKITVASGGIPPVVASGIFTPSGDDDDCTSRVLSRADAGYQWQASVGGEPKSVESYKSGEEVVVNGRTYFGPVCVARGVSLREISFVVLGGDRRTSALVARRKNSKLRATAMTFEEWLMSLGFADSSSMDDVQRANMQILFNQEYPSEVTAEGDEEEMVTAEGEEEELVTAEGDEEEMVTAEGEEEELIPANARGKALRLKAKRRIKANRKPIPAARRIKAKTRPARLDPKAERKRIKQINKLCARYGNPSTFVNGDRVSVAEYAISAGWSPQQAEITAMRNQRPNAPSRSAKGNGGNHLEALAGALILRCGGSLDSKAYRDPRAAGHLPQWLRAELNDSTRNKIMDQSHILAKMSFVDITRESLRASGKTASHDRDDMIRAAFSTASLGNVLTTSVNAILIATYLEIPDSTIGWTKENTDVANYLLQERPRVPVGGNLSRIPENGEADHDEMSDVVETYKVARYGKQFEIDEIAVINDSLGAIMDKPKQMAIAAARLRPDLVYNLLLSNPTLNATGRAFFNSTDGNLRTSAALSNSTLSGAIAAMKLIRENRVNIDVTPTHLIAPPSLSDVAYQLLMSQLVGIAGTAGSVAQVGTTSPFPRYGLQPISDPRLENGLIDPVDEKTVRAGSATSWYLASSYAPAIEVGFLRGQGTTPRVRSWLNEEKGKFGQGWDVSLTVGVCPLDWRGLQRNNA